jgi:hypothetical protein
MKKIIADSIPVLMIILLVSSIRGFSRVNIVAVL